MLGLNENNRCYTAFWFILSKHLIAIYFIAFTNYPVFDAKIIICWYGMHEYNQPHETNLNIKKKYT